jgi:hypothetical protein
MHCHANAALTPKRRAEVFEAVEAGMTVSDGRPMSSAVDIPDFERPANRDRELAGKPGVVRFLDLPDRRFVMIDGEGPAGDSAFAPRLPGLYATAWGLRFALKRRGVVTRVGPLEGLWWTSDGSIDLDIIFGDDRGTWRWTLLIALPDGPTSEELTIALEGGRAKLEPPYREQLRIEPFAEGRVAQLLHLGPYAAERPSIERLHAAITDAGLRPSGRHHELYLGDPRRVAPEKIRTLLRQAVA